MAVRVQMILEIYLSIIEDERLLEMNKYFDTGLTIHSNGYGSDFRVSDCCLQYVLVIYVWFIEN